MHNVSTSRKSKLLLAGHKFNQQVFQGNNTQVQEPQFSAQQGLETFAWGLGKEAELLAQLCAKSYPRDTALLPVPRAQGSGATCSLLCSQRPDRLAPQFLVPKSRA